MTVVAPLETDAYAEVLPLVAAYQRFYDVDPDDARNERYFRGFLAPSDLGMLLGARVDRALVGYACLHWRSDTVAARDVVCLHDLYVNEEARGRGAGRALLEAAAAIARDRGAEALVWSTAPDNAVAQRLYDRTGATRSTWIEYDLPVAH
ncbi:MAG: GNAT family N-acetyltransferase [Actinobacteria bacterium]|nr:GNAT family N-acetyltransferase [Actinomycetota bacterium]